MLAWKSAIRDALDTEPASRVGKAVSVSLITLIALNIVAVVSGTVEDVYNISPCQGFHGL